MTYTEIEALINANLASGNKIPADKHREVEFALLNFIQENLFQSGDIKAIKCDVNYLNDNFEADGRGKNLRLGWRILSEASGRTLVSMGVGFALGQTGGSKDAVVVEHSHTYTQYQLDQEVSTNGSGVRSLNKNNTQVGNFTTSTVGVSGTDKNLQPYYVILYIEKI